MASRATALDSKGAGTKQPESSVQADPSEKLAENEIAILAYRLWEERGCPSGSPEEDWFQAENELKSRGSAVTK